MAGAALRSREKNSDLRIRMDTAKIWKVYSFVRVLGHCMAFFALLATMFGKHVGVWYLFVAGEAAAAFGGMCLVST